MTRIIMSGCSGKMGHVITELVSRREKCEIVAGVDFFNDVSLGYPVHEKIQDVEIEADVVVDFSNPSMLDSILEFCIKRKVALVLCTTGFSASQVNQIKDAANNIPIFYSGNMSLGINLLISLSKIATKILSENFDVEIVEKHHNQKIDAPSGTAIMIADEIAKVFENQPQYVYDRHVSRKKRSKNEIGLHSIRGGTIVGEHEVIFAGQDETISITHQATSKSVFASGAVDAAAFVMDKSPGLYQMSDLIKEVNKF